MPASPKKRLRLELSRLRDVYLRELPEKLASLRRDASRIGEEDDAALQSMRQAVHRLAGSAAIFGLPELSAAARELELGLGDAPRTISEDLKVVVERGIARLEAAWSASASSGRA